MFFAKEVTEGSGNGFRIKGQLIDTSMPAGFRQSIEGQLIFLTFKSDWVAKMDVIQTLRQMSFDAPPHAQQNRSDQGDQTKGMIKNQKTPDSRIAKQSFDTAEQAPGHPAIDPGLPIDIGCLRLCLGMRIIRITRVR